MVLPCGCNSGGVKDWVCGECGRCTECCKCGIGFGTRAYHVQTLKGADSIHRARVHAREELEARQ